MYTKKTKSQKISRKNLTSPQKPSKPKNPNRLLLLQQKFGNQVVQRLLQAKNIQAKLTIGAANDKYEKEADKVADHIVRKSSEDEKSRKPPEQSLNFPTISRLVQRTTPKEDAADQVAEIRAEQVVRDAGSGQPMPEGIQRSMERSFGRDFSHVRMHTDSSAQKATADLNARAFTHQNHIWLGRGENVNDKRIMAHELTHVVQQGAASKQASNVQRIQRQGQNEASSEEAVDAKEFEIKDVAVVVKKGPVTPISKPRSSDLDNLDMSEGELQRKESGVPDIQRADPATVGAAVAVTAITYQVFKDLVNINKGDITYTFDRMRGQKYPNNNKNWEKMKNWKSTYWDIFLIYYNGYNVWVAGQEVRLKWEYNGYGLSGIYFTKKDFWDKPGFGADFTWIIQPLMATRKDINGHPVAKVKIEVDGNLTRTIGSDIPRSKSWVIDGEGGGKRI